MGFREFFQDGSVVKHAVSYIIGISFTTLVNEFVVSFMTPFFGIFGGIPVFKEASFTVNGSRFNYGHFVDVVIGLLVLVLVLYLCIILPFDFIRKKLTEKIVPLERDCPFCFTSVSKKASRCPNCTSEIEQIWPADHEEKEEPICDCDCQPKSYSTLCIPCLKLKGIRKQTCTCNRRPKFRFRFPCIQCKDNTSNNINGDAVADGREPNLNEENPNIYKENLQRNLQQDNIAADTDARHTAGSKTKPRTESSSENSEY